MFVLIKRCLTVTARTTGILGANTRYCRTVWTPETEKNLLELSDPTFLISSMLQLVLRLVPCFCTSQPLLTHFLPWEHLSLVAVSSAMKVIWISLLLTISWKEVFPFYSPCGLLFGNTNGTALITFGHNQLFMVTNHIQNLRINVLRAGI